MNELQITEYKQVRVLTTQQIADAYGTNTYVISRNFSNNKERYAEGKHYICLTGDDLREAKANGKIYGLPQNANKFYLWTEKGAFLHAKSLNTDKAWEVYDHLVDTYFKKMQPLTLDEQIQILAKGNVQLVEKINLVDEDLQSFKKEMPLLAIECETITKAKRKKVFDLTGSKDSNAYQDKSLRGRIYKDLESQLIREFGVGSYKAIKRNQTEKAVEIITSYELPLCLKEEVVNINSQMNLEI